MSLPLDTELPSAGLTRQFAAMVYDSFLILAVLFISMGIAVVVNGNQAIAPIPAFIMSIMIIFLFYSWFWTKSGQTLGMVIWKVRIISEFGGNPSWQVCFLRLFFSTISLACLGLGYWVRWFKPFTLPDIFSQTRIVQLPGKKKEKKQKKEKA